MTRPVARRATEPARVAHPTQIVPAAEQQLAPAPPAGMRVIGYTRDLDTGLLHPTYGPQYEPPAPLPPPAPGLDPQAQRTAARGVFAAGAGVGVYFGVQALALALDALVTLIIAAAAVGAVFLAAGRRPSAQQRPGPTYVTNNRGFMAGWKSQNGPRR